MTVSNKARIKVFNLWWWLYVVITVLSLLAVTMIGRNLNVDSRFRLVLIISVIEFVILRLYKHSLKNIRDDYNYFNELPCYLCNQATILCIIGAWTRNNGIMAYCVSIGTLGAILAFVMPDSYNRDQLVFSPQAYGFYGYHGLLIVTCMSFFTLDLYQPVLKDCVWATVWTLILAVIAHVVNVIMRKTGLNTKSNYVFTYYPDNFILQKMYDLIPVKLIYLSPVLPVFSLFALLLFGLLKII